MTIKVKPLSVNKCWQGRRFKTPEYKKYETLISLHLRSYKPDFDPSLPLEIIFEFGFSNKASDLDNPEKPMIDILQKVLNFNDNKIYKKTTYKTIVKKGEEFIRFEIANLL